MEIKPVHVVHALLNQYTPSLCGQGVDTLPERQQQGVREEENDECHYGHSKERNVLVL